MYELIRKDGAARRGRLHTVHGVIETPVFMNVGTVAAIKGAVSTEDLERIGTQVELSNTYHLHVRPGDQVIRDLGGLHRFMSWDRPILTDSGGFQVFSLAGLRRIREEGVYFHSHIDGKKIFMGPEESMRIQSNLGSTIAMAFDECPSSVADRDYIEKSVARTTRWLARCKAEMDRLNSLPDTINRQQLLFGINQGGICEDIRIRHAQEIAALDLDGYAVGGLASRSIAGASARRQIYWRQWTGAWISSTACIPAETAGMAMCTRSRGSGTCSTQSMSWTTAPLRRGASARPAAGIPEPTSAIS